MSLHCELSKLEHCAADDQGGSVCGSHQCAVDTLLRGLQAVATGIASAPPSRQCSPARGGSAGQTPGSPRATEQLVADHMARKPCGVKMPRRLQQGGQGEGAVLCSTAPCNTCEPQPCSSPVATLLRSPFTSSRPRRLVPDPLQPTSPPHPQSHSPYAQGRPRNVVNGTHRNDGYTARGSNLCNRATPRKSVRTRPRSAPWTPAGTGMRLGCVDGASGRHAARTGYDAVPPRYLDYRSDPRHCGSRRRSTGGDERAQSTAARRVAACNVPRVALLPPPQRGEALAETLGVQSFAALQAEAAAEVRCIFPQQSLAVRDFRMVSATLALCVAAP